MAKRVQVPDISPDNRIVARNPKNPWCDLGAEVVVLRTEDNAYYRLDSTGRYLWMRLETPQTMSALLAGLVAEFDAPADQIARQTREFVVRCEELDLVTISDA